MSEPLSVESILSQIGQQEKEYDWLGAAESYKKALVLVPERDFLKLGEIHERLGYACYRAAMQAESLNKFRKMVHQAVDSYEKAKDFFSRLSDSGKEPRMIRCDAMIAYARYWLESAAQEKKKLLEESWKLARKSLEAFKEVDDTLEYGKTYNQLSSSVVFGFCLEWDFKAREKMIKEAVEHGEQTIKFLSAVEDPCETARAYARTAFYHGVFAYYFLDADGKQRGYQKTRDCWARAKELSEDVALSELIYPVFGPQTELGGEATEEAFTNLEKALEYGRKTRDKFIIGCALDWLTYHTAWKRTTTEDPDERRRLTESALKYAEDAKRHYSIISFTSPRTDNMWVESIDFDYFSTSGFRETDVKKKQALFEKATAAAREVLKRAESSGYIEAITYAHHISSIVLRNLAMLERRTQEKKAILLDAMKHREESIRICEQITPLIYWARGVFQGTLALLKYDLAELARDTPDEKNMLQEAISDYESAFRLCSMEMSILGTGSTASLSELWVFQSTIGVWLNRLYELTGDKECLRKALKALSESAELYQKINLKSRVAECQWKAAQTYDSLGEHLKAAENFTLASNNYKSSVEKVPQLKKLYEDHVLYMLAWAEIEKARYHHKRQEYGAAKEHFEKAADLHKSLKQWNYMAPNYSAWMHVENAEELSRKERSEEALEAFEQAANLFEETRNSLQTQLSKIENQDEKQMATNMIKTSGPRREYCVARISIEEARILDKKGDHFGSSEKYGSAAEVLAKIAQELESDQERKEFGLIVGLSHAWQKMTLAESEASPELYAEASRLFEEARDFTQNERTKMLFLGHSRFCKALEEGTKFADTRDVTMHAAATKYLESAANYYVNAGFPKASEYAKATQLLFDAYVRMDDAKRENDPEKKAKLYMMAEKVLQTSAGSFMKAEHPEKRERVLRLLEKVEEERELAVSLTEVLHAPSIVSSTTVFTTPTPTHEEAVGSERFEHADIQANIVARQKELKVGENLDLEIELVNAGKGTALLTKLTEVLPEGFELIERPETYRLENNCFNLKGKRLDPLKTEEVKLVLKPRVQGTFSIKPRVLYLDENGKYKSHELEPITITVKELGIKGWLKGER